MAEGLIADPPGPDEVTAQQAWLGPMVDAGFMHSGYLDHARARMWMVVSGDSLSEVRDRLADLPASRAGTVTFTLTPVSAIRFR